MEFCAFQGNFSCMKKTTKEFKVVRMVIICLLLKYYIIYQIKKFGVFNFVTRF